MGKKGLDRAIISAAIVGILISTYALFVEMTAEADPEYKAYCDLAEKASCSKVLTSDFSKGFGMVSKGSALELPNCIYGIVFYCLMIIMTTYDDLTLVRLQFLTAVISVVTCGYLAYILLFVLRDFCVVCVSTYFVNGSIAALVYRKLKYVLKKCR
ncbi:vitamin K epoxide reductase complex subunit 1-like protein 1 isoform X2 [Cydia pomonella]|nr:vitamin K epoxide reductase complex subunit 1-like protein 1 isoform X2 [Cydia pomonella]XP_061716050.1 vitamin K epoxide reductase complex subunit 1-like protein 1 isoform X2 [Cydia pomonella]